MYVRITFEQQQITKDNLESLRQTLSDEIDFEPCVRHADGKIKTIYSWQETLDPKESETPDEKGKCKELVFLSDYVQLNTNKEYICDMDLFFSTHPDIKVKLRGMPKTVEQNYTHVIQEIVNVQNKLEDALQKFDKQIQFNEKVNVHVGGFALMSINQMGFGEDMCTEEVQKILNKGWKILAVMVQPSRRPDYIFGKYNPDINEDKVDCVKF
ncbi:MAG: hypothetical protein WA061_02880 [Microgenomates group bacterium]